MPMAVSSPSVGLVEIREVIVFIALCRLNVPASTYSLQKSRPRLHPHLSEVTTNHHRSASYSDFARASEVVTLEGFHVC